jgi:hypothetical protein
VVNNPKGMCLNQGQRLHDSDEKNKGGYDAGPFAVLCLGPVVCSWVCGHDHTHGGGESWSGRRGRDTSAVIFFVDFDYEFMYLFGGFQNEVQHLVRDWNDGLFYG